MIELILGGARSGKSRHALQRAGQSARPVLFVATAEARDAEMAARIAHHQSERPAHWRLVEEPLDLAGVLRAEAGCPQVVLVDCLTLWLSNWLCRADEDGFAEARLRLLAAVERFTQGPADLLLVANEVGLGVIPMGELSRRFVDEAGRLNQDLAGMARNVVFLAAGLPLSLKGTA